jgi:hypothetical protein
VRKRGGHRRHRASPGISAGTRAQQRQAFVVLPPEPDDEYANYQHNAMINALASDQAPEKEEGPVMTDPNPLVVQLQQELRQLTATVREQREALGTLRQAVLDLEQAVDDLRDNRPNSDPLVERVFAVFETAAPVKLSYTDVSDELEISRDDAWRAVARLVRDGRLVVTERRNEGSNRTFRKWTVAQ